MNTKIITRINNVDIVATSDERFVPIRPICDAIGIDAKAQRNKIERDEILSSVGVVMTSTGRDGKSYEMFCIPFKYVFGRLFSIDTSRVNPEAHDVVLRYKEECYDALYRYFTEPQTFLAEKQQLMEQKLQEYQECQRRFKDAQKFMNTAKQELNQVMAATIDDWRANNGQLQLPFMIGTDE